MRQKFLSDLSQAEVKAAAMAEQGCQGLGQPLRPGLLQGLLVPGSADVWPGPSSHTCPAHSLIQLLQRGFPTTTAALSPAKGPHSTGALYQVWCIRNSHTVLPGCPHLPKPLPVCGAKS